MNFNVDLPGRPIKKTPPINIPQKNQDANDSTESTNECDVSVHFFDPSNKSPPNSWTNRLESRFDQFSNFGSYLGNSFGNTVGAAFGPSFCSSIGNNLDNFIIK